MRQIIALSLSLLLGCGPGLADQLVLQSLADRAKASCASAPPKGKAERCELALACAQAAGDAARSVQAVQEARSKGTATAAAPVVSQGLVAAAKVVCQGVR